MIVSVDGNGGDHRHRRFQPRVSDARMARFDVEVGFDSLRNRQNAIETAIDGVIAPSDTRCGRGNG